jgi:lipid A disaccharide synthetase
MRYFYSTIIVLNIFLGFFFETQASDLNLIDQESVLNEQLNQATTPEQIAKVSLALATVKKQQSLKEMQKLPELVGRDRSFLSASVRESLTYRQVASSFKQNPGNSSAATTYFVSRIMSLCCAFLGFFFLVVLSRYRY